LPNYYYRDDACDYWKIIESYVGEVLGHYYTSDQEVVDDYEIDDWIKDVLRRGIRDYSKGYPCHVHSIKELIEVCTVVIFTCSVQHSGVNFDQFNNYKFVPNAPLGLRKAPFKNSEMVTLADVLASLPDAKTAGLQPILADALSRYMEDEEYIGDFRLDLFTEPAIRQLQARFKNDVQEQQKDKIEQRNEGLPSSNKYKLLLPKRITATLGM